MVQIPESIKLIISWEYEKIHRWKFKRSKGKGEGKKTRFSNVLFQKPKPKPKTKPKHEETTDFGNHRMVNSYLHDLTMDYYQVDFRKKKMVTSISRREWSTITFGSQEGIWWCPSRNNWGQEGRMWNGWGELEDVQLLDFIQRDPYGFILSEPHWIRHLGMELNNPGYNQAFKVMWVPISVWESLCKSESLLPLEFSPALNLECHPSWMLWLRFLDGDGGKKGGRLNYPLLQENAYFLKCTFEGS